VKVKGASSGQALVEYLLMTLVLLFCFTLLYRGLQKQLGGRGGAFERAGKAILTVYY
jgi:hypothetical protein